MQVLVGAAFGASLGQAPSILLGATLLPLVINAVNFMDGINGITALTLACWGGTAAVIGITQNIPEVAALGALTTGSAIGFLPWNIPRARLFLGDVGSYLFGGLAATGLLLAHHTIHSPEPILLVPLATFLADVGITLVRRAKRRAPLTKPHREHIYQTLVWDLNLKHQSVAAMHALTSAVLVALWLTTPSPLALAFTAIALLLYVYSSKALLQWRAFLNTRREG
jgi:UDP-N-acetylmuramyl pentapeptide phosphotransferase/UDP-N-acetylglucosamine-1-phosphate transferase